MKIISKGQAKKYGICPEAYIYFHKKRQKQINRINRRDSIISILVDLIILIIGIFIIKIL